jgi:cysteine sulfinate desulfinase/cysteine desulfurase-like protein
MVDPHDVDEAITVQTVLISIMHANNEIGTVQPIRQISEIGRKHGVLVHSDCAQSVGKIAVNVDDLGVDLLSIAGHKIYAPKGIGALYIRRGTQIDELMQGAGQESGRRPGTENVIYSVALGEACALVEVNLKKYSGHMREMRDNLESQIVSKASDAQVNGHPDKRLPNTLSISFKGLKANEILDSLETVAASAGAACHSDSVTISSVLEAMKIPIEVAMGTVRLSTGRFTTEDQIDRAATEVLEAVDKLTPKRVPVP